MMPWLRRISFLLVLRNDLLQTYDEDYHSVSALGLSTGTLTGTSIIETV